MSTRALSPKFAGPSECCCGPTIGTITCVSRQGNGYLRGASKFQSFNSGDWNGRKFTRVDMAPTVESVVKHSRYDYPGGATSTTCPDSSIGTWSYHAFDGAVGLWNVSANVLASGWNIKRYSLCVSERTTLVSNGFVSNPTGGADGFFPRGPFAASPVVISDNVRRYGPSNAAALGSCITINCLGDSGTVFDFRALAEQTNDIYIYQTLSVPDTVSAALARGSPTVASNCRTTGGSSISSTSGGSTGQITITGPRSVVATIPISGLTASTAYILTVKINRYVAGGGSYVDFVYDTIEFTAGATEEEIEYDVPVNTDYDYEIDTSYKDIAAA